MSLNREQQALTIYLKLLESKGLGRESISRREAFLVKFSPQLINIPRTGIQYRETLDIFMDKVASPDWPYSLAVAREFYPFWMDDIKTIASFSVAPGYEENPIAWQPNETTLKSLWNAVNNSKFDLAESWALKAYTKALRDESAVKTLIDTRVKLAKVLLIRLKDAPVKHNAAYRVSVDATMPLFAIRQNRRLFLLVVREFFHFWSGNPEASKFILKEYNSTPFNSTV